MSMTPEQMRHKEEAKRVAEYHHANGCVDRMRNEKPSPSNSVKPNMDHNRTGLGPQQEDQNG